MGVNQDSASEGKLHVKIGTLSGKNKKDQYVWEVPKLQGFVKVEVRGGEYPIQFSTNKAQLNENMELVIDQEGVMEVPEAAKELRVMLCYEKVLKNNKKAVSTVAACGIYMQDIRDLSFIDKKFQLFRPMQAGEGGTVELCLNYVEKEKAAPIVENDANQQIDIAATIQHTQQEAMKKPKKVITTKRIIIVGAIVAATIVGVTKFITQRR
eukprot:TRINITY_DN11411_c0_g2_i1.p5 TRINITY_DN11411_c0_g2~~TRINITY_DN11411_c0_g2_i1.p5  ORF type:complete len:247 (-),score=33.23 TRINITY_DN11411_c0_g2_i1:4183-4812(-)